MLRLGVRTFVDRVLDLPWLLVAAVRRAISTLRRRSPEVLDAAAAPLPLDGARRGLAATARRSVSAVADVVVGVPASLVQRRFRPLAPRALALVGTPIATLVLVLVIAAQAPSLVRAQHDQDVLALVVQKEPAPAAAVRAGVVAPARATALARRKPGAARAATVSRRSAGALQAAATVEQRGYEAPATGAEPAASATRASAPKTAPRAQPKAPVPDRPRPRNNGGGGGDQPPAADEPTDVDATPTGEEGPTGGGDDPQDDEPQDEEPQDDDPSGGGGGGDDDRGDRERDDRDRDRGDEEDDGGGDGDERKRDKDDDD